MSISRRARALLALAMDNWLSRGYLAVVGGVTVWFLFDTFFVDHPDASMAGVVPWLLTMPLSLLCTLLPDAVFSGTPDGAFMALYLVGIAIAALANAAFMGRAVRGIRSSGPRTADNT